MKKPLGEKATSLWVEANTMEGKELSIRRYVAGVGWSWSGGHKSLRVLWEGGQRIKIKNRWDSYQGKG